VSLNLGPPSDSLPAREGIAWHRHRKTYLSTRQTSYLVKDSDPAFDCLKKRKNISAAREESHRAISRKSWRKRSTQPASIRKELIRRQQENDRADLKFFESLSHGFAESARLTNERTKEMIAGFPGKYLPPGVPAPPAGAPVFQILSNASRIDLEPFGPSSPLNSYQSSITSEGNLIQFDQTTCIDWHVAMVSFLWTPPRGGVLTVIAPIVLNGSWTYAPKHRCYGETLVQIEISAGLSVTDATAVPTSPYSEQFLVNYFRD
jgi:hypothetical protein